MSGTAGFRRFFFHDLSIEEQTVSDSETTNAEF